MKTIAIGKWTSNERNLFHAGCIRFGWGRWKEIAETIPTRDLRQVKSHAQKFALHHPEKKRALVRANARECRRVTLVDEVTNPGDVTDEMTKIIPTKLNILDALGETKRQPTLEFGRTNEKNAFVSIDKQSQLTAGKSSSTVSLSVGNNGASKASAMTIPSKFSAFGEATFAKKMLPGEQHDAPRRLSFASVGAGNNAPQPYQGQIPSVVSRNRAVSHDETVITPSRFDVLCALGEAYSIQHCGNRRFQVVIEMNLSKFEKVLRYKYERKVLVDETLSIIKHSGGRFLQRHEAGYWKVASDAFARKKIELTFISYIEARGFLK